MDEARLDFEAFVLRSQASLLRTAWLLTGDHGLAEDVVQTALERVARRWGRLSGEPEAYARRVVVNLSHDSWRRRRVRPHEVTLQTATSHAIVGDGAEGVDLRVALIQALRALPYRQRTVLVLRYFLDLDEAETARCLDIGIGTVKSSASRGLAALRTADLGLRDGLTTEMETKA